MADSAFKAWYEKPHPGMCAPGVPLRCSCCKKSIRLSSMLKHQNTVCRMKKDKYLAYKTSREVKEERKKAAEKKTKTVSSAKHGEDEDMSEDDNGDVLDGESRCYEGSGPSFWLLMNLQLTSQFITNFSISPSILS
jgi:hypothetical protein